MDKSALRKQYRHDRKLLTSVKDDFLSWSHILSLPEIQKANVIASYHSYGDEPDTSNLNQEILKSGKKLLLPRMLKDFNLEWVAWSGENKALKKSGNFFEPIGPATTPDLIEVVIVPSLHVNRSGFRLGQGGGSYDRALSQMRAWRIGLIYSSEITNEPLPIEAHDQQLDAVATPELTVKIGRAHV